MATTPTPASHAARLLREAAEELKLAHTIGGLGEWKACEPEVKAAYDEHIAVAAALEAAPAPRECLHQIAEPDALAEVSKEQYARMFGAACDALGQISDHLGIDSDIDPGAKPIIEAIDELRAAASRAAPASPAQQDAGHTADMQAVGEALMDAIESNYAALQAVGWSRPMDCPSEIVADLIDLIHEAQAQAQQDAPATGAVPDERQAFEHYQGDRMRRDLLELTMHADGRYDCDDIQAEWEVWQARAALAAAPAAPQAPAAPVDIAWRDGSVCNPPWTDDSSVRVIAITAQHDFGGVQVHDILASDFYGERTEVTNVCTHWAYRDEIWPRAELPAPASQDAQDAARYRWLREGNPGCYDKIMIYAGKSLDAAIDVALVAKQAGGA